MKLFKKYKICPKCHEEISRMGNVKGIYYCPKCCIPRVNPPTRYAPSSTKAITEIKKIYDILKNDEKKDGSLKIYRNKDAQIYMMGSALSKGELSLKKKYKGIFVKNDQIVRVW